MHDTPDGPYRIDFLGTMLDVMVELVDDDSNHIGEHCLIGHSYAARHRLTTGSHWDSLEHALTYLWQPGGDEWLHDAHSLAEHLVSSDDAPTWLRLHGQNMICHWQPFGITANTWRDGRRVYTSRRMV